MANRSLGRRVVTRLTSVTTEGASSHQMMKSFPGVGEERERTAGRREAAADRDKRHQSRGSPAAGQRCPGRREPGCTRVGLEGRGTAGEREAATVPKSARVGRVNRRWAGVLR